MRKDHHLLVILNTSSAWGGLEINTVRLAKWINQYRQVFLFCTEYSPIAQEALKQGLTVKYVYKGGKYLPLRSSWKLYKILCRKKISHILFCDNKDMAFCCWAKVFSRKRIKIFYQQHMQLGISKKDMIHTWRYNLLDAWISPLPWLANEVRQKTKINPIKIQTIPLGLDTTELLSQTMPQSEARALLHLKSDFPVLGIMGRLDPKKNQHILIRAAKELKDQNSTVHLFFVGEPTKNNHNNYVEDLYQLIRDLDLEAQVSFHPFTDQIAAFYQAIDLFVMATDGETYGMVTLESMLFETPILATNLGGSPEILQYGELGTLFEPGNAHDLSKKVTYILNHPDEVKQKAIQAKKYVIGHFDYTIECEQLLRLMDSK